MRDLFVSLSLYSKTRRMQESYYARTPIDEEAPAIEPPPTIDEMYQMVLALDSISQRLRQRLMTDQIKLEKEIEELTKEKENE